MKRGIEYVKVGDYYFPNLSALGLIISKKLALPQEMFDRLVKELSTKQGITEEFKAKDQIAWISAMEQIKHTAEEFVFQEIYI